MQPLVHTNFWLLLQVGDVGRTRLSLHLRVLRQLQLLKALKLRDPVYENTMEMQFLLYFFLFKTFYICDKKQNKCLHLFFYNFFFNFNMINWSLYHPVLWDNYVSIIYLHHKQKPSDTDAEKCCPRCTAFSVYSKIL